jgi:hypothetical protein
MLSSRRSRRGTAFTSRTSLASLLLSPGSQRCGGHHSARDDNSSLSYVMARLKEFGITVTDART